VGILSSALLLSSCSTSKSDLSDIQFTRADCISGIYGLEGNDSAMYLEGYVEVSNPDIDSILIEVEDPTTLEEFWNAFDGDIPVDASGKANFSHQISDYVKKHETWNFKMRVVARETESTDWKEYEFMCPDFMLDNLPKTK
jgi:hypothetical protein